MVDEVNDQSLMENHARRKEFIAALQGTLGSDERRSHTLGIPFLYVAAPVSGGAVRLAYPLSDVEAATRRVSRTLLVSSALAFLIAMLIAGIAAQYSARRLRRAMQSR